MASDPRVIGWAPGEKEAWDEIAEEGEKLKAGLALAEARLKAYDGGDENVLLRVLHVALPILRAIPGIPSEVFDAANTIEQHLPLAQALVDEVKK